MKVEQDKWIESRTNGFEADKKLSRWAARQLEANNFISSGNITAACLQYLTGLDASLSVSSFLSA